MEDFLHNVDPKLIAPYHEQLYKQADSIVHKFVWGYFAFGLFLSAFHGTWAFGLGMGGITLVVYFLIRHFFPGTLLFRCITSFVLMNFVVQFIFQMKGAYTMQFFYFITLTVLLLHEDWRILLPSVVYAIFFLVAITLLQRSGAVPEYLANFPILNFTNLLFHMGLMVLYAIISMYWVQLQRKQTEDAAVTIIRTDKQLGLVHINKNFADEISAGNLEVEYQSEHADELGKSLMNMRKSLIEAARREEQEKFVNVGLANIGEVLRSDADNLDELCDKLILKLVNYLKVNQGGIFLLNENGDVPVLQLKAFRAYEQKKYLQKTIDLGEGLVGQVALEKKYKLIKDVPEDYATITSGLGKAVPKSILVVPLESNDQLVGVLEFASLNTFQETDIEFLEKVGESIAATVISVHTNHQTRELLENSKQMTEEMRAQEEEMRQNMEEMQSTQEEMARTQKELAEKEAKLNALINNTEDSIITIDHNYKIGIANEAVKRRYQETALNGVVEGTDALAMRGELKEEWKGYYDKALNGERLHFTKKSSVKGEDSWREYFIQPIKDKTGSVVGISVFSRDITAHQKVQDELAALQSELDTLRKKITV